MKYLRLFLLFISLTFTTSCEKETEETEEALPPIASFTPLAGVICSPIGTSGPNQVLADISSVGFQNNSTGEISSYSWDFEDGLGSSNSENPEYIFDFEGLRNVTLTVSGPGGTDTETCPIRIFAFPICTGFLQNSTYNVDAINHFRNNNLVQNFKVKVTNPFANAVTLRTYSPDDWLDGIYSNIVWSRVINPGATETFLINQLTNEWGVQISAGNGSLSCVRIVGRVGFSNGTDFLINAQDIDDGVF